MIKVSSCLFGGFVLQTEGSFHETSSTQEKQNVTLHNHEVKAFYELVTYINETKSDLVFDVYVPSSLKAEARTKRGRGTRRRVTHFTKTPTTGTTFCDTTPTKQSSLISLGMPKSSSRKLVNTHQSLTTLIWSTVTVCES